MDAEVFIQPKRFLRIMTSIDGIVVLIESLGLLGQVTNESFAGLGVLSSVTVSFILFQVATFPQ
ncbi:MAG: hypothetical protein JET69_04005 [Methanomassiliicoccales archaeon]|nr:hypothetical protein [Methanomassiliicoccales archaeon]